MPTRRVLLAVLLTLSVVLTLASSVSAQDNSAVITQAIANLGTNCAGLTLNTTCLGNPTVQRTTSSGVVSTTYSAPGSIASTSTTHQIQTSQLNAATGDFGINVMRIQGGQAVGSEGIVYVAFGGTTISNVRNSGQALWQSISLSIDPGAESAVPFFFIQGPENGTASVTVNGKTILISSTVLVWFSEGQMRITVISGSIVVDGINVPTCSTISAPIVDGVVGTFGAPVAGLIPTGVSFLGILPSNVLNYPVGVPVVTTPSGVGGALPQCSIA
jgi:hypothetical protein